MLSIFKALNVLEFEPNPWKVLNLLLFDERVRDLLDPKGWVHNNNSYVNNQSTLTHSHSCWCRYFFIPRSSHILVKSLFIYKAYSYYAVWEIPYQAAVETQSVNTSWLKTGRIKFIGWKGLVNWYCHIFEVLWGSAREILKKFVFSANTTWRCENTTFWVRMWTASPLWPCPRFRWVATHMLV